MYVNCRNDPDTGEGSMAARHTTLTNDGSTPVLTYDLSGDPISFPDPRCGGSATPTRPDTRVTPTASTISSQTPKSSFLSGPSREAVSPPYSDDSPADVAYRVTEDATVTGTVRGPAGKVVYRHSLPAKAGDGDDWTWDGRTTGGTKVTRSGTYTVTLTATTADGRDSEPATFPVNVVVSRAWLDNTYVWQDPTGFSETGNCHIYAPIGHHNRWTLDCWGSGHAAISYTVKVPAGHRGFDWDVIGGHSTGSTTGPGTSRRAGDGFNRRTTG